jgi:transcriptional regulator with XRE-family HTH domain
MFKSAQEHVFKNKKQRQLLGDKLALARLIKGYSQADALRACGLLIPGAEDTPHEGGVTRGFLSYVESGIRGITLSQLEALATLYGVSVEDLTNNISFDQHQKRMLTTLRAGMYKSVRGRKPASLGGRSRSVVAVGQATPKQEPVKAAQRPKPSPAITTGDIAILDVIRDCSEPEKAWIRDAILKLKIRMRPGALAASAY